MKKWMLLVSSALLLLFSCMKKESIEIVTENEEISVLLNIPNDIIFDKQSVDILIHDKDGVLVEKCNDIENKRNYEFVIQNEISPVLFSLIFKSEGGTNQYRIESLLIKETINLTLGDYTQKNISEAQFKILYDSDEERNFVTSSSSYTGNGSTLTLKPRFFPPNELISFTEKNSGLRKVVNIIAPLENETFILDSLETYEIKDSSIYQVNETGLTYSTLYGKRKNIDQHYIRLSEDRDDSNPVKTHYLPIDSINDFVLYTEVDSPEKYFGAYELKSSFDLDFSKPEIDLVINEVSINKLNITSINGDFFKTSLLNSTGSGYRVSWEIHGVIEQSAEIEIPNIDNYMKEMESNYIPENLMPRSTSIYKTQQQWNYDQFISFSIESIGFNNIPSSIEYFSLRH